MAWRKAEVVALSGEVSPRPVRSSRCSPQPALFAAASSIIHTLSRRPAVRAVLDQCEL